METTNFGFVASLLFVGVPTIFLIGLFISTQDGEKSSFYSSTEVRGLKEFLFPPSTEIKQVLHCPAPPQFPKIPFKP